MNLEQHYAKEIAKLINGTQLTCNGYPGTVKQAHKGQLAGMVDVKVPGGLVCVSIGDLKLENLELFAE